MKTAAKQLVFIHFWMVGSRKFLDSHFFQKKYFFQFFQFFLRKKFSVFLKIFWNSSKFEKRNANSLKIAAKHLVFHLGTAKSNEKLAEKFENSSKTASFHPFLNGWQQKISGVTNFSEIFRFLKKIFRNFWKISEIRHSSRKATQKVWK